jgi:hypothetical protein
MMGADKVAIPTLSLMNRKRKPCYATAIILVDWPNSDLNHRAALQLILP